MTRQYIACQFNDWDERRYTYHNDGEPVAIGDECKVEDPRGGWKRVKVTAIVNQPEFATKPILGPVDQPAPAEEN